MNARSTLAPPLLLTVLLGGLSALPPLAIDMNLPALPAIEAAFPDAAGRGALTLGLFLFGFSLSPIIAGPLSDRYGRRPLALFGLLAFALAALVCTLSPGFGTLLAARLVQGIAAGFCAVVPFAVVRDRLDGIPARTMVARLTMVIGLAPMLAPIAGGWVMSVASWPIIYLSQAVFGLVLALALARVLEESLPVADRRALQPSVIAAGYRDVIVHPTFRHLGLAFGLSFACKFSYIAGSAAIFIGALGLSEARFALVFAVTSCGLVLGSFANERLARRGVSPSALLWAGMTMQLVAAALIAVVALAGVTDPLTIGAIMTLLSIAYGVISPSAQHGLLQPFAQLAGTASGLVRSLQMGLGAVASALVAALSTRFAPIVTVAGLIVFFAVGSAVFLALESRQGSRRPQCAPP